MKDGVLSTPHLKTLPLPLQMELIFDINVGHFHDSLLLRDMGNEFVDFYFINSVICISVSQVVVFFTGF